ncbi:UDP-N-acetylmuramate dehydrogenase [Enterobacteriaceae endosymbiont of Macroplea appendiculata]|uniref:UDP-N-acetylmuramate dehydrogenase n=1 Tax=Enterobacteriaceae endosymbiont of Macroplea appendiculata TaxID=2675790 RepID=UPI001449312A|nr:UDP-N-acetylmuramate dehydrogenase [Enterobacteriaceae endosymbiont of Macroplea appendiculata]QJC30641.1 UDP-N-acetylmuramate dehydrogenase [Enterobacteriaceae endosymbiont of Macroplea appendiculata]
MLSLKKIHTFHVNVYAYNIIYIYSVKQLYNIWYQCKKKFIPYLILGKGSNVLFTENFHGFILLNRIKGIKIYSNTFFWNLHVGAGESWHKLVKYTIKRGIYGLENLALIPGCIGAAPIQNIGAYGMSLEYFCSYVDVFNPYNQQILRIPKKYCYFNYRNSIFKSQKYKHYIIIAVGLSIPKQWTPCIIYKELKYLNNNVTAQQIFQHVCNIRHKKLPNPNIIGNAGSFFKNPFVTLHQGLNIIKKFSKMPYILENNIFKISAAWLIEKCNFKGIIFNGASVYHKQALVIINKYNASGQNILNLANKIYNGVGKKFGIWLEAEIRIFDKKKEISQKKIFTKNKQ